MLSTLKDNLQDRLNQLKSQIELDLRFIYAKQLVGQAERTLFSTAFNRAKDYVITLPDCVDSGILLDRLQDVEYAMAEKERSSKIAYATQLVEQAERIKTHLSIINARDYANNLPNCTTKTELLNKLDNIK